MELNLPFYVYAASANLGGEKIDADCILQNQRPLHGRVRAFMMWLFWLFPPAWFLSRPTGQPEQEKQMAKERRKRYSRGAGKEVAREMRSFKRGTAKSSSGQKVKSRKQAIAIGLSKARKKDARVPKKRSA